MNRRLWYLSQLQMQLTVILFLTLLGACPGRLTKPAFIDNPGLHPHYGGPRYFKAVGTSNKSREEAELIARANVSAQITSSIEAAINDRIEEVQKDASRTEVAEYSMQITSKTKLDRAELIRVDPNGNYSDGTTFYTFAYLDRKELQKALEPEYEAKAVEFGAYATETRDAYSRGNPQSFAENYNKAAEVFSAMTQIARVLSVASGYAYPPHRENQKAFFESIRQKLDFRSRLRFFMTLDGPDSEIGQPRLKDIFQRCFEHAGLTMIPCEECPCLGLLDYRFQVTAREEQKDGMLGPICSLSLSGTVLVCKTKVPVVNFELFSKQPKGAHTNDRRKALKKLYQNLDDETIIQAFERNMRSFFP